MNAEEYVEPWLIQRLEKPYEVKTDFEKGVGVGGSNDSRKLIKGFCRFDYMGSSEFEFGTIPETMEKMGKVCSEFVRFEIVINKILVYGFCHPKKLDKIKNQLSILANNPPRLKESTYFDFFGGVGRRLG